MDSLTTVPHTGHHAPDTEDLRTREESDRFIALCSHYLFESRFCRLGEEGAQEKGRLEGGLGHFGATT